MKISEDSLPPPFAAFSRPFSASALTPYPHRARSLFLVGPHSLDVFRLAQPFPLNQTDWLDLPIAPHLLLSVGRFQTGSVFPIDRILWTFSHWLSLSRLTLRSGSLTLLRFITRAAQLWTFSDWLTLPV